MSVLIKILITRLNRKLSGEEYLGTLGGEGETPTILLTGKLDS